jgi:hypothetical protein
MLKLWKLLTPLNLEFSPAYRLGMMRRVHGGLALATLGCGVIGNTADSGSVVLGSSPGTPAKDLDIACGNAPLDFA